MSIDSDIRELDDFIACDGGEFYKLAWERVSDRLSNLEIVHEAIDEEISRCNANVMANNNLFNYLIESGVISRKDMMEAKIKANPPSWYKDIVVSQSDKEKA